MKDKTINEIIQRAVNTTGSNDYKYNYAKELFNNSFLDFDKEIYDKFIFNLIKKLDF